MRTFRARLKIYYENTQENNKCKTYPTRVAARRAERFETGLEWAASRQPGRGTLSSELLSESSSWIILIPGLERSGLDGDASCDGATSDRRGAPFFGVGVGGLKSIAGDGNATVLDLKRPFSS